MTCEPFIWGNCEGNKNNFGTSADCYDKCRGHVPTESQRKIPLQIVDTGGPIDLEAVVIPGCTGEYGCCNDGYTPASGPDQKGCPG